MTFTAFGALQPQSKRAWGKEAYKAYRDNLFFRKLIGSGENAVVDRVTELTKTEKGEKAMIHLVADLVGGGIVGDNQAEGRESEMQSYWQEIQIDQLRKAVKNKGRMDDQKSVIRFRKTGKDKLGQWGANTVDDLLILTASGISYAFELDGSVRVVPNGEDNLNTLSFAADVKPPSANRHFRFDGTNLQAGDTGQITSGHLPKYGMMVDMMAEARTKRIKPLKAGGMEYFVWLMHPKTFAMLKKDDDFRTAVLTGMPRSEKNPIFTGATVTMDGAIIHTSPKAYNTMKATSGSKWGAGGAVNGTRSLMMGAQALALADLGSFNWEEELKDYKNRQGIAIDKMFGILKPQFYSIYDQSVEDFGLMVCDTYIQ